MYAPPEILATFDASEILGEAYGHNPGLGNEGNWKPVGNGSAHSAH
jgi:hypothetical protein